jgi:pyrroloquinoline quinone (PQQ) biosynthesis protein C
MLTNISFPLLHPYVAIRRSAGDLIAEDDACVLRFHGESADLVEQLVPLLTGNSALSEIAERSGVSGRSSAEHLEQFRLDGMLVDAEAIVAADTCDRALASVRELSVFWNRSIRQHPFPTRLFSGKATREEVLGWAMEFYYFIRGANSYMARGVAVVDGETETLRPLWDHYVEESDHDEIFRRGLLDSGISEPMIRTRQPIPSTRALVDYLWEIGASDPMLYAATFAVMQPLGEPPSREQILEKYAAMRTHYPFASGVFDAFERHDVIDADLGHCELLLDPVLRRRWPLSLHERRRLQTVIRETAEHFIWFMEGIQRRYKSSAAVDYRPPPNAYAVFAQQA